MTEINPNARTPFVNSEGKLAKYGMDTILKLYRILNVSGESSVIDSIGNPSGFLIDFDQGVNEFTSTTVSANYTP